MPSTQALYVAIALLAGAAVPFLASINAAFCQAIGSAYRVSMVLCVIAFATILGVALATGATLPSLDAFAGARWWHYAAGCFFMVYVVSITFVAPTIGLGNAIILVVVAQIFTAVLIDNFGLFAAQVQPLDWKRAIGIALLPAGVALARSQPTAAPAQG